jgi:hypothetical protein
MTDGPYDFARERRLAEEGKDLVADDEGRVREVRRGELPREERRVGDRWIDEADIPREDEL